MPKGIIKLEGLRNFRSLSSVKSHDGKRIKEKRLYRSASLNRIGEDNRIVLRDEYEVKRIIDLRTELEVEEKPDIRIEGVEYYHIPVMEEGSNGVSREKGKTTVAEKVADYLELEETYAGMGRSEYSLRRFGEVVRLCLYCPDGAVLWHCSAGKDRTGIVAFLLLKLFGFPDKAILHDYLLTNASAKRYAWRVGYTAFSQTKNRRLAHKVFRTFIARRKYLKAFEEALVETCGSLGSFYLAYCGIDEAEILRLREEFLA